MLFHIQSEISGGTVLDPLCPWFTFCPKDIPDMDLSLCEMTKM